MSSITHVTDGVVAWALAQPVPSPTLPASTVDEADVTPGVLGFIAIAFVAIAVVLLVVDMTRRVRRTRYRGEVRERIAAEREERAELDGLDERDERAPGTRGADGASGPDGPGAPPAGR